MKTKIHIKYYIKNQSNISGIQFLLNIFRWSATDTIKQNLVIHFSLKITWKQWKAINRIKKQ